MTVAKTAAKPGARRAPPAGPMAVRVFARWYGVSHTAVQQRIAVGVLHTSAKKIRGRWKILDALKAAAEWEAHTRPRVAGGDGHASKPSALARATQREREARAKLAELEYQRKSGDLVPIAEVKMDWAAHITACKTTLLGLPTHAKQRLPHLTVQDLAVLDALVREALEELAGGGTTTT